MLAFVISEALALISEGTKKFSSYESGIEPFENVRVQFQILSYIFDLVFIVFEVETVFLFLYYYLFLLSPMMLPTGSSRWKSDML